VNCIPDETGMMIESQAYTEIVSACDAFQRDRRLESLIGLIPQARLYDYGFRSLVGPLEATRARIWEACGRFQGDEKWCVRQVLDQLDELDMLRQLEVPNDFRAITVHFAFYHKALSSIRANLERACASSEYGLDKILWKFNQAMESVTASNGVYVASWNDLEDWRVLHIPDVGLEVVKLIYANRHSLNLATIPNKVSPHKHSNTSEIHFSLEPTDGDEIVGRYRVRVAEPYAVPIRPGDWHAYEQNKNSRPHKLFFLTGSPQLLGWGIVNDRTVTESSKLTLTSLGQGQIQKVGGVLLERAIQDAESQVTNKVFEKELISSSSTDGLTLSVVAIPDSWSDSSPDAIHLVTRGAGELSVLNNRTRVKEGDVFAIPFCMACELQNETGGPLVLLSSILKNS